MSQAFDIVVIGAGPGGYVAAIRAAQLGFATALVEKEASLGGTCLNVGCIPSKALLDSSEHYHNAAHTFGEHGIELKDLKVNLKQMIARKADVVSKTVAGVEFLMKKNKVQVYRGTGSLKDATTVLVRGEKEETLQAKYIILATGSVPGTLLGVQMDGKRIISSTEALELTEVPKKMLVIGGGVIGLELGSVYGRLGAQVQVVEYADGLIPTMDKDLGKEIQKILKKQLGFEFFLNHRVQSATVQGDTVTVTALDKNNQEVRFEADYCLLSVGRKPYTDGLDLEQVGIALNERGQIPVNDNLQTTVPNIYAIGDCIRGAMLAHKASDEGVVVVEKIAGHHAEINYLTIPGVVYTWPEVASVGYTEQELKDKGMPYKTGKFPFMASGRARASMDLDGFVKVLAHKDTDEILGVHIIGPRAADIIAEAVALMEFRASAEDAGIFSHAHPTFTEALKEAALAATGNRAIHI
ncbi:MAG: dihydrolipoyl dehydrogenase [Bacteroidetes bacterium]|jgi:dihydrolipoamide dehydrogenase|nr:dihydrolipoyl dehydrogenase [Bacteroidota bacterium]